MTNTAFSLDKNPIEPERYFRQVDLGTPLFDVKVIDGLTHESKIETITSPVLGTYWNRITGRDDSGAYQTCMDVQVGKHIVEGYSVACIESLLYVEEVRSKYNGVVIKKYINP